MQNKGELFGLAGQDAQYFIDAMHHVATPRRLRG
jgi:hypothetical protein